jgi:hypothetical protein
MYNIMGIWPIDQELLSCKPIATFRWNEMKNKKRRDAQEVMISWLTDILNRRSLAEWLTTGQLTDGRNCRTLPLLLSGNI